MLDLWWTEWHWYRVFSKDFYLSLWLLIHQCSTAIFSPLNAELNPICHLLALVGAYHILHASRIRVIHLTLIVADPCGRMV